MFSNFVNRCTIVLFIATFVAASALADETLWGVHNIWGPRKLDERPDVRGSYTTSDWATVNPSPGVFDFSEFDQGIERARRAGKPIQVAIRGKTKPDYLFFEVPYNPNKLSRQVGDEQGTLAFWHPTYMKRYKETLIAFGKYLREHPDREFVYSVRTNLNAIGTEHDRIDDEAQRADNKWIVPDGVKFVSFSQDEVTKYTRFVNDVYRDQFSNDFIVFIRNSTLRFPGKVSPALQQDIDSGKIGLLHTTSMPEPVTRSTELKYERHTQYGRDGVTPIYAEPFTSSTRGNSTPQPPPQWNYWRLLSDLDSGATYISVYGIDLDKASDPEYAAAFDFTNTYAGYQSQRTAARSPGAWVALKEGGKFNTGDYTFLMTRMEGDANKPLTFVGPDWQRFGAWAREIPANGRMRFQIDDRFADSLNDETLKLRVTYLNSRNPSLTVKVPGRQAFGIDGGGTGTWKTAEFEITGVDFMNGGEADIVVQTATGATLHMIEVTRGEPSDQAVADSDVLPEAPELRAE